MFESTYSLHCSSFLGLPFRIPNIDLEKVIPKKGTTMDTIGTARGFHSEAVGHKAPGRGLQFPFRASGFKHLGFTRTPKVRRIIAFCGFGPLFYLLFEGLGRL